MRSNSTQAIARLIVLILFAIQLSLSSFAQSNYTISGTVKDKLTGESLVGASIKFLELKGGTTTNSYGFFSITLPQNSYTILTSYVGFQVGEQKITLSKSQQMVIELIPASALQEVVVRNKKRNDNITKPLMGVEKLDISVINQLPVLLGERDVLKSIQLLPGIKSAGEGNSGFYVRGGGADQNLILLDEAPVYNASHLLGFFSTFNSDAIKDLTLYKGGMPAQYGGRLSSVVDIKMKEGNNRDFGVSGGLGVISSRINIEGPIVKDESSFIISGRRSYADVFSRFSSDSALKKSSLYFYDLNLKANYKLGKRDHLYLSGYFGRDVLGFGETFSTDWGNSTATLRWNHIVSNKIFSNTSLIYSDYNYKIKFKTSTDKLLITSQIRDVNLKQDFDYFINNSSKLRFGANIIRHTVSPGRIEAEETSNLKNSIVENRYSLESAIYGSHELAIGNKLNLAYGIRFTNFTTTGPGTFYTYDKDGNKNGADSFGKGQTVATYLNIEPRFSASYQLTADKSVKVSYNRNVQNLHLITNSVSTSPTDLWLPSSNNIKPETADQFSVGYYQNFKNNQYEFSVESYYKSLQNQIDYRNGASLIANNNIESELLYGKGRAYGIELFLKKKFGRLNGWVGYTLSKTERKFDGINNGNYYNARQDRTHDVSVVGIYKLNNRWSLSSTFVYSTGNAVTFPSGKYYVNNQTVFLYSERNGRRMPAYHRLDLAATFEGKRNKGRKYQSSWTFGLYNAYGRENAYIINFKDDPSDPSKTIAEQISLFKYIPSVSWNFKF
ncbi:MAG: TonB-dependent receptor SusC [Segetibacter sp.]|nr:TonB-dependent receptor SusC [Segetibacter sp.]